MIATDRAAALELAALVVQNAKYGMVNDERLVTVARALLAAEAERERLESLAHAAASRLRSAARILDVHPGEELEAASCRRIANLITASRTEPATTDTERHDG